MQEDEAEDVPGEADVPANAKEAAGEALAGHAAGGQGLKEASETPKEAPHKRSLSNYAKGAIFREVVLAKVREIKEKEAQEKFEEEAMGKK